MTPSEISGPRPAQAADRPAIEALQKAAYAPWIAVSGRPPLPMRADYAVVLAESETWLVDGPDGRLDGALILQHQADAMLIWSVAVDPGGHGKGLGQRLLALAEDRARAAGKDLMRLYTNAKFQRNREIYERFGYAVTREEAFSDDNPDWIVVHMEKGIAPDGR